MEWRSSHHAWELELSRSPSFCCGNDIAGLCWQKSLHPRAVLSTAGKKSQAATTVLNNILLIAYLLLVGFILLVNPVSRPRIPNSLQWRRDNADWRGTQSPVVLPASTEIWQDCHLLPQQPTPHEEIRMPKSHLALGKKPPALCTLAQSFPATKHLPCSLQTLQTLKSQ